MSPQEFKKWFAQSRVVDEAGAPVIAFRGERGASEGSNAFQSRVASLTFGSSQAASTYSLQPNMIGELAIAPRVTPAYLKILRPFLDSPDDPFLDLNLVMDVLGEEQARRIASKFAAEIMCCSPWQEEFASMHGHDFQAFLQGATAEVLGQLYFEAYYLLDDPVEVDLLSAAGFDGAIYSGSGISALEPEYRVFDAEQVMPAIAAGWPARETFIPPSEVLPEVHAHESRVAAIQRVRGAIEDLIGAPALRLGEGLGRVVVTTSRELAAEGACQLSVNALASFANESSFRAMLAEQRAAKQRAIASIGQVEDVAIVRRLDGQSRWQMILRDASEPGKWRTQSFDLEGFSGHMVYETKDSAIDAAAGMGFTVRDDAALDRIQDSPAFQRGLYAADLIMRVNTGKLPYAEADQLLAQYDESFRALNSVAMTGAQAFVASSGETVYMLADRIEPGTECAVFLHEMVHRHGRAILGVDGWTRQVKTLKSWSRRPEESLELQIYLAAFARAQAASGGNADLCDEELFAYAVEEAVTRGVVPSAMSHPESASQWLDAVTGSLRGVLAEILDRPYEGNFGAQETVDMAYALAQLDSPARIERIAEALSVEDRLLLQALIQRMGRPMWYSQLERKVEALESASMPAEQWIGWLKSQVGKGVKPDELHWSGVCEWLELLPSGQSVTRARVLGYLRANGVVVNEVINGGVEEMPVESARADLIVKLTAKGYTPYFGANRGALVGLERRVDGQVFELETEGTRFSFEDAEDNSRLPVDVAELGLALARANDSEQDVPTCGRYAKYTVDGGEKYRECLLVLGSVPDDADANAARTFGSYQSHHWLEADVLAHVRLTDRRGMTGEKILFVEEIQSDWAQEGKRRGFELTRWERERLEPGSPEAIAALASGAAGEMRVDVELGYGFGRAEMRIRPAVKNSLMRPAPFVTSTDKWVGLAIKRVVRMAVDGGYDGVAFTSGDQQVERYSLARDIGSLEYKVAPYEKSGYLEAFAPTGERAFSFWTSHEELPRHIGADLAQQLLSSKAVGYVSDSRDVFSLKGLQVRVGGQGMRAFYDEVLPSVARDIIRRLGGDGLRLVDLDSSFGLDASEEEIEGPWPSLAGRQLGFDVTPRMRLAAAHGLPLFSFPSQVVAQPARPTQRA